jgi:hypothetical protein
MATDQTTRFVQGELLRQQAPGPPGENNDTARVDAFVARALAEVFRLLLLVLLVSPPGLC